MDRLLTEARVPLPEEQPTLDVPTAGRFLGLSKEAAYNAAARGDIPILRIGRRIVVPTAALRRMLLIDPPIEHEALSVVPTESTDREAAGSVGAPPS